jgi:CIC family chloride channel protein
LSDISEFVFEQYLYKQVNLYDMMHAEIEKVHPDNSLTEIVSKFERNQLFTLPVVDNDGKYQGLISKSTLFTKYRQELIVQSARF